MRIRKKFSGRKKKNIAINTLIATLLLGTGNDIRNLLLGNENPNSEDLVYYRLIHLLYSVVFFICDQESTSGRLTL